MSSIKAYKATIEGLKPHSNANKLQLATILGNQVVVGLDAKVDTSGVLFLPDAIISQEIVDKFELTYLTNNRVRVVKLRGEYSEALFIPMPDEFITEFGLNNMWEEYVPPQRKQAKVVSVTAKKQAVLNMVFPKHMDTQQYLANQKQIEKLLEDGWAISYSIKTHGTCVTNKARIRMADGSIKLMSEISIGDVVASQDGDAAVTDKFSYPNINNWMYLKFDNISVGDKNKLFCTKDHLIQTDNGWVEAKDITYQSQVKISVPQLYPTQIQRDVYEGKLWGDGHFNKHLSMGYAHKENHREYTEYCRTLFGNLHKSEDIRTSGYGTTMIRSLNKVSRFLPEKPTYLNPLVVAIWYMDDGSLSHSSVQQDRANLAICRYTDEESLRIVNLFNNIGLYPTYHKDSEGYNRLRFNLTTANDLFEMIAEYVSECMQYKLPEKYRGRFVEPTYQVASLKPYFEYKEPIEIGFDLPKRVSKRRWDITTSTASFIANNVVVHNSGRSAKIRLPLEPSVTEKTLLKYSYYLGMNSWYSNYLERKYENKLSTVYTPIFGSRNVVFKPTLVGEVNKDFRKEVHSLFEDKLYEDECIYYEILGYADTGKPIMEPYKGQPYNYGLPNGTWGIQVYRITQNGRELNPWQLELRCNELNVMPVYIYSAASVEEAFADSLTDDICFTTTSTKRVSITDYTHTNEGLVIRLDKDGEIKLFKYKNREFLLQEGILPAHVDGESNEQTQQETT